MPQVSIVIPCFNEAENVSRYSETLLPSLGSLPSTDIVAVDDGSTDGTFEALDKLRARGAPLEIVRHERNWGLGAALRGGFARAGGEWIVTLDADMTFSPSLIAALVRRQRE